MEYPYYQERNKDYRFTGESVKRTL